MEEPYRDELVDVIESAQVILRAHLPQMSEKHAKRALRVAFTNSKAINACTFPGKAIDFVLITIGTFERVYSTLLGLLSLPTFLPNVGNRGKEQPLTESLLGGFSAIRSGPSPSQNDASSVRFPVDPARFTFAMHAASVAMRFLVAHEVGHILAGHLDMKGTSGDSMPSRIVLECDADRFATHLASFVELDPATDSSWQKMFATNGASGRDLGFIAYATAITVLFRLLVSRDCFALGPNLPQSYPDPTVRSAMVVSMSAALAMQAGRFNTSDIERLIFSSVYQVEQIWAEVFLPGQRLGNIERWRDELGRLNIELMREFERWKSVLKKFARVPARWHDPWWPVP